jgi:hypothetical protein
MLDVSDKRVPLILGKAKRVRLRLINDVSFFVFHPFEYVHIVPLHIKPRFAQRKEPHKVPVASDCWEHANNFNWRMDSFPMAHHPCHRILGASKLIISMPRPWDPTGCFGAQTNER